jgi:hypothetical protein
MRGKSGFLLSMVVRKNRPPRPPAPRPPSPGETPDLPILTLQFHFRLIKGHNLLQSAQELEPVSVL